MERAYNLTARQWEAWMGEAYRPSYNVAPSQRVPVTASHPACRRRASDRSDALGSDPVLRARGTTEVLGLSGNALDDRYPCLRVNLSREAEPRVGEQLRVLLAGPLLSTNRKHP